MIRRSERGRSLLIAAAIGSIIMAPSGVRWETAASDLVIVREADVITEDLYAAGERIIVRGVVEGDLVAAAFNDVTIEGVVEGDVLAVASEVIVTGRVEGSVRALSGSLVTGGLITDDVFYGARSARLDGSIDRDVVGFGWRTDVPGTIGRELKIQMLADIAIPGVIGADAEVNGRQVDVSGDVGGDLRYRGDLSLSDRATVSGLVAELGQVPVPIRVRALVFGATLLALLSVLGIGAGMMWLTPRLSGAAAAAAERPWRGLAVGVLAMLVPPAMLFGLVALFASTSADLTVPALVAVAPLGVAYLGTLALGLLFGFVPASTMVGRHAWRTPRSLAADFAVGATVWALLSFVRPLGVILLAVGLVAGFGSVVIAMWRLRADAGTHMPGR